MLTCDSVNNTLRESAFSEATAKCKEGKPFCGAGRKKPHTVHAKRTVMCHNVRTGDTVMSISKVQECLDISDTSKVLPTLSNWKNSSQSASVCKAFY